MFLRSLSELTIWRTIVALLFFVLSAASAAPPDETGKLFEKYSGKSFQAIQKIPLGIERVMVEIDFCDTLERRSQEPEHHVLLQDVFSHMQRINVAQLDWARVSFVQACLNLEMPELAEATLTLPNHTQRGRSAVALAVYYLEKRNLVRFTNTYSRIISWSEPGNSEIPVEDLIRLGTVAATNGQRALAGRVFDDAFRISAHTLREDSIDPAQAVVDLCSLAVEQERLLFSKNARQTIKFANAAFRNLGANERGAALYYLNDSTLRMGDIKDAERLVKYFPMDLRQSRLFEIAVTDGCLGNVHSALRRISKLTPSNRDSGIAAIAACHAEAGKFDVAEMLLSRVGDSECKDRIRSAIAVAYASQNDSRNATNWMQQIERPDIRETASERAVSGGAHSFVNLGPAARLTPKPFFCGNPTMERNELKKQLESSPDIIAAKLQELEALSRDEHSSLESSLYGRSRRYLELLQTIGEVLGSDPLHQKLLADWESRFAANPLAEAYLFMGAAKATRNPIISTNEFRPQIPQ